MLSTRLLTFSDPKDFMSSIRAVEARVIPTSKGNFHAALRQIAMDRLWMQHGSESLARIIHATVVPGRVGIDFLLPDQPSMRVNGVEVSPGEIVINDGKPTHRRTAAASRWVTMSLAMEDFAEAGKVHAGRDLPMPTATTVVRPMPSQMARLLRLHRIAGRLARHAPWRLAHPRVADALEHALIHALVTCLTHDSPADMPHGSGRHTTIISKLEAFLGSQQERPLYVADLCRAVGVSERTLRICFHEHFGIGPIRYLWLRRMHQAREALLRAGPQDASVTDIAMDHGFWELGRFSVEYRRFFGESPSDTLRRPAGRARDGEAGLFVPARSQAAWVLPPSGDAPAVLPNLHSAAQASR
jgi:AraC-like DNA-binding protein